jgi:hypothetical protein
MSKQHLRAGCELFPGQPLWQRVPSRDEGGRALHDFMMLIPKLGSASQLRQQQVMAELQQVFSGYGDELVFVDLNLKLSLLWVSLKPRQGICLEFAAAIKQRVPEAVLVASHAELLMGEVNRHRRRWSPMRLLGFSSAD